MMKTSLFILILFFCSRALWAADAVKLVLIYPGGEGDQQEASTLMGLFSDALKQASGVSVNAEYHAQRENPKKFATNQANNLLLMRVDTYLEWKETGIKLLPVLITQPSFDSGSLVYHIYGARRPTLAQGDMKGEARAVSQSTCQKLFLGIDLGERMIRALFGDGWKGVPLLYADEPLEKLEAIAHSTSSGQAQTTSSGQPGTGDCLLLESRQWQSLATIPFLWKDNLALVQESIPTLHPMIFTFDKPSTATGKTIEALKKLSDIKEDKEIMTELQVKAFAPLSADESKTLAEWEKRYEATRGTP